MWRGAGRRQLSVSQSYKQSTGREAWNRAFPRASGESMSRQTSTFQTSGLQSNETINFCCCSKAPRLWYFVRATLAIHISPHLSWWGLAPEWPAMSALFPDSGGRREQGETGPGLKCPRCWHQPVEPISSLQNWAPAALPRQWREGTVEACVVALISHLLNAHHVVPSRLLFSLSYPRWEKDLSWLLNNAHSDDFLIT